MFLDCGRKLLTGDCKLPIGVIVIVSVTQASLVEEIVVLGSDCKGFQICSTHILFPIEHKGHIYWEILAYFQQKVGKVIGANKKKKTKRVEKHWHLIRLIGNRTVA